MYTLVCYLIIMYHISIKIASVEQMNNQRVNSRDDRGRHVAHNQIPVPAYLICRCTGNARICPEIFLIVPAIQS